jgi:fatty acid desaturase
MGGPPHQSDHHAFPALPSARLPEASARINVLLLSHQRPLPSRLESYRDARKLQGLSRPGPCGRMG